MPGKYSHSVVLADYSTRGIISLPPDQHSRYTSSAPLNQKPSISQLRLRGTRSAQAIYRGSAGRSPDSNNSSSQQHLSPGGQATTGRAVLNLIPEDNAKRDSQGKRYSGYYDQQPKSTPTVGVIGQSSHPELRTAYQRQQQIDSNLKSLPPLPKLATNNQKERVTNGEGNVHSSARASQSNRGYKSGESDMRMPALAESKPVSANGSKPNASTSDHTTRNLSLAQDWRFDEAQEKALDVKSSPSHVKKGKEPVAIVEDRINSGRKGKSSSNGNQTHAVSSARQTSHRTDSHGSESTQIWSPKLSTGSEPDFDGFSDANNPDSGYFDTHRPPAIHSRSSSLNSTLMVQRPGSSDRPPSRGQRLNGISEVPGRAIPISNSDPISPSRATESSLQTSSRGQRSGSSVSSLSTVNDYPRFSSDRPSVESPRKNNHIVSGEQPWRLPEIKEDNGFSPSIFEDKEGHEEFARYDGSDDGTMDRQIGQISSGKDVMYDNSDAASELSAALPPPITRFRDDEDEFNATMSKLFGEGGDHAIVKKGSHSVGRSATKKTKGFFAKFRSKS